MMSISSDTTVIDDRSAYSTITRILTRFGLNLALAVKIHTALQPRTRYNIATPYTKKTLIFKTRDPSVSYTLP